MARENGLEGLDSKLLEFLGLLPKKEPDINKVRVEYKKWMTTEQILHYFESGEEPKEPSNQLTPTPRK